jgi:hypothetical protein
VIHPHFSALNTNVASLAEKVATKQTNGHCDKVFAKGLEHMTAPKSLNKQRYIQPDLEATSKVVMFGNPDMKAVGTSIIERHNRTVRVIMRRTSRAVDSFSKSFEHHKASMALVHMYYDFARVHKTIGYTPGDGSGRF